MLKQIARSLLHPFREPVTWACQHGFLPPQIRFVLPWRWVLEPFTIFGNGWQCRWFPTELDAVGHTIFWSGMRKWEKETSPVILDNIRRSRCFIDVGANCGIYTVIGCTINPSVRVVAVEPTPRVCKTMENNIAQNNFSSRVTILNIALGDTNGIVSFHEAEDATMSSLATSGYRGQQGKVIEVQCRTLDSIVEELKIEPDFMKIDVEGFEHVVLSGAKAVLGKYRPRIVLEANPGDPADRVTEILSEFNYTFQLLTDNGPESRGEIVPDAIYRNWLCVPA